MSPHDRDTDVGASIRKHATRHDAPSGLRGDIMQGITRPRHGDHGDRLGQRFLEVLLRPLVAFAFGAIVAGVGVTLVLEGSRENPLVEAMIADHARSVVSGQTIEVASANTHTVKPWLSGKLGYSPVVVDLAERGYPLVGGRRGFLGRTAVGVLVYQHGQHEIDVYALPMKEFGDMPRRPSGQAGYNMTAWGIGDIQYIAVSDASVERVRDFGEAMQQRQEAAAPGD